MTAKNFHITHAEGVPTEARTFPLGADGERNIKLTSQRMHMSQNASTYSNLGTGDWHLSRDNSTL